MFSILPHAQVQTAKAQLDAFFPCSQRSRSTRSRSSTPLPSEAIGRSLSCTTSLSSAMRSFAPSLAALWASAALSAASAGSLGGWQRANVTSSAEQLLADALTRSDDAYVGAAASTRVCFVDVLGLETQVVAGTNYRFLIAGCDVTARGGFEAAGECADEDDRADAPTADCDVTGFLVQVFEQNWTDTLQVTNITAVELADASDSEDVGDDDVELATLEAEEDDSVLVEAEEEEGTVMAAAPELSNVEKAAIDAWLEANSDSLNEFGDPKGTYYTGGTPLFDETTGEFEDKYLYIERRHPDRPWNSEAVDAGSASDTLRVTMLAVGDDAVRVRTAGHSFSAIAGVVGSLCVFVAALIGVAAFKLQHGRVGRRFQYNPISDRSPF